MRGSKSREKLHLHKISTTSTILSFIVPQQLPHVNVLFKIFFFLLLDCEHHFYFIRIRIENQVHHKIYTIAEIVLEREVARLGGRVSLARARECVEYVHIQCPVVFGHLTR